MLIEFKKDNLKNKKHFFLALILIKTYQKKFKMRYILLFFLSAFITTAQNTSDFDSELLLKNDFSIVSKDNKYGMTNKQGEIVVPLIYDKIETYMFVDYAVVSIIDKNDNEKSGIINLKNEVMVPVIYDKIELLIYYALKENPIELALVKKGGKYGLIEPSTGKIIAPAEFVAIGAYPQYEFGINILVTVPEKNREPEYYEEMNKRYQKYKKSLSSRDIDLTVSSFQWLFLNPLYGVVDINGKEIIPLKHWQIKLFYDVYNPEDTYFEVTNNDNREKGLFDINGKEIMSVAYDEITSVFHTYNNESKLTAFQVTKDNKHGLFSKNGEELLSVEYDYLERVIYNNDYKVKKNGLYGIIDIKKNVKIPIVYNYIGNLDNGKLIEIHKNNLVGVYGVTDKEKGIYNKIIPEEFTELSILSYDTTKNTEYEVEMIKVKKDGLYGVYNQEGNLIVSVLYDDIKSYNNRVFLVEKDKKLGLLKLNGEMLLPFQSNSQIRYNSQSKKWEISKNDVWRNIEEQLY